MDPTSERRPERRAVSPPANLMVRPPVSLPPNPPSVTPRRPPTSALASYPKFPGQDKIPEGTLVIGQGIQIKGEIESCDTLIVEGTVEATLEVRRLEIRCGGRFAGEATVVEAEIDGSFDGRLLASDTLTLGRRARVKGSIRYGRLQVENGGQISGDVEVRPVELSVAGPRP